jgi:hypothetical protein
MCLPGQTFIHQRDKSLEKGSRSSIFFQVSTPQFGLSGKAQSGNLGRQASENKLVRGRPYEQGRGRADTIFHMHEKVFSFPFPTQPQLTNLRKGRQGDDRRDTM